jgi:hypothetical protein
MKKKEKNAMNKLKKLGFKKVPGTAPGFHMYELNPAEQTKARQFLKLQSKLMISSR